MDRILPDIVVPPAEIREIVVVGKAFLKPADLGELDRSVPGDLGLRCLKLESGVPGSTFRTVKPATVLMRMRERRVDDPVMGNTKHQLVGADARKSITLGAETVIGRMIQIQNAAMVVVIVGDPGERACPALAVDRRNKPVRAPLQDKGGGRAAQ